MSITTNEFMGRLSQARQTIEVGDWIGSFEFTAVRGQVEQVGWMYMRGIKVSAYGIKKLNGEYDFITAADARMIEKGEGWADSICQAFQN
jgi:hypothetical protein